MELSSIYLASIPVLIGIIEVLKKSFKIPSRFVPLISLIGGIGLAFGLGGVSFDATIQGVILGLTASGLYSSGKATLGN